MARYPAITERRIRNFLDQQLFPAVYPQSVAAEVGCLWSREPMPLAEARRAPARAWKLVLLNQFHDVLPGSSIGWVYEDSAKQFDEVRALAGGAIRQRRRFGKSSLVQTVRLAAGSRRLEFVTEADWHEKHRMLRAEFPLNVRADRATCEIQFGHTERTTSSLRRRAGM
jgi:alpha-mannosidase